MIAGYYRIAADPAQLRHQFALTGRFAEAEDIVRAANLLRLQVAHIRERQRPKRLGAVPYPALIGLKDGGFAILAVAATKGSRVSIDPIAAHRRGSCRSKRPRRSPRARSCSSRAA